MNSSQAVQWNLSNETTPPLSSLLPLTHNSVHYERVIQNYNHLTLVTLVTLVVSIVRLHLMFTVDMKPIYHHMQYIHYIAPHSSTVAYSADVVNQLLNCTLPETSSDESTTQHT